MHSLLYTGISKCLAMPPKDTFHDLVRKALLAFHAPSRRPYTGFAVA